MSVQTCSTMPVSNECTSIRIGGTKIPMSIEGEIFFTHTYYPAKNMQGRMEDAEPSDEEVTLDEVDLTVTLWGLPDGDGNTLHMRYEEHCVIFKTNSIEFYEEHFGELDCMDVIGYT